MKKMHYLLIIAVALCIVFIAADLLPNDVAYDTELIREKMVRLKGNGNDTVTVMVYMNGSDLESKGGAATDDLKEMVSAGHSDKVNIVVQTMGTKKWKSTFDIASDRTQRYKVNGNGLKLLEDDLGQLDCTQSSTLCDFVEWSATNYPADRYILLFWNHGGGPVYGFGYDEWNTDETASLTLGEIQSGLKEAGVYFDFIGMDCCIMSSLETCLALYEYCDYTILSEDFESGIGWTYTNWLRALYADSSIPTTELGKMICEDSVWANENNSVHGADTILALIDQTMIKVLYTAWTEFAYANEEALLSENYSHRLVPEKRLRTKPGYDFSEYYVTDIMEVAQQIDAEEAKILSQILSDTLIYTASTKGNADLSGMGVILPYGDSDLYADMKEAFTDIGMDNTYIKWLEKFTGIIFQ